MQLENYVWTQNNYTIIIVTHNMQQAARASDYTVFYLGGLIEYDKTTNILQNAKLQLTNDYVSGHFRIRNSMLTITVYKN